MSSPLWASSQGQREDIGGFLEEERCWNLEMKEHKGSEDEKALWGGGLLQEGEICVDNIGIKDYKAGHSGACLEFQY